MEKDVPEINIFTERSGENGDEILVGIKMTEYREGYPYHTISRLLSNSELRALMQRLSIYENMSKK